MFENPPVNDEDSSLNDASIAECLSVTQSTLTSKFGLTEEEIDLPATLKEYPTSGELGDDVMFRDEVARILPEILEDDGGILIIQNIATQHAVATMPVYLEAGLDTYFTFIHDNAAIRPSMMQGSYYHPDRVISVALANKDRISRAKERLEKDKLKGVVIQIDAHADYEDNNGEFDRFLPDDEKLRKLGLTRVVFLGEFPAQNAQVLTERRINNKEDWDKSHVFDYLRQLKSRGFKVTIMGIDPRQQ
jgi:hypothetical protein